MGSNSNPVTNFAVGGVTGIGLGAVGGVKGITDFAGLTDSERQKRLEDKANELSERSINLAERSFDVQKSLLDKWGSVYGNIEENLSDFYKNLTPTKIESFGLQVQEKAFNISRDRLKKVFKQRGIESSGIATEALTDLEVNRAVQRSTVRATAPEKTAQLKQNFLSLGLPQKQTLAKTLASAGSGVAGVASQAANLAGSQGIAQQQSDQQTINTILGIGADVAGVAAGSGGTSFVE